jgi:hypothetical protein
MNEEGGSPLYRKMVRQFEQKYWPRRETRHFQAFVPHILKMIKEVSKRPLKAALQKSSSML